MSIKKLLISLSCVAIALPAFGTAIPSPVSYSSTGNIYYVGVEDAIGGDYDYNDLIFSLTGSSSVTLYGDSGSALFAPVSAVNPLTSTPPAFWNNESGDGAGLNYGQCLYNNPTACNGPFAPTASYLAESGTQASSQFYFGTGGTVTLDLLANITANKNDINGLEWCLEGTTTCNAITFVSGVATFTPTGNFDLALNNGSVTFDSNLSSFVADGGIDHFAVAVGTPEPGTLAIVGTVLVGLGVLRRRYNKK